MISAARQGGRQCDCDSWGAIALHPWASWDPDPGANCSRAFGGSCLSPGTAGETVPMRQPKLSAKGCLEELDLPRMPWESHKHSGKEEGTGLEQQNPAQPY